MASNTLISRDIGGSTLSVFSGGSIVVYSGGKIRPSSSETLPTIGDPTGGSTVDAESRTAIASIIDALQGVGILGS